MSQRGPTNCAPACGRCLWVELDHGSRVLQRVLLQRVVLGVGWRLGRVDHALHLVGVDEAGHVSVGHARAGQLVALLHLALSGGGACRSSRQHRAGKPQSETLAGQHGVEKGHTRSPLSHPARLCLTGLMWGVSCC